MTAAVDLFAGSSPGLNGPATHAAAVAPSDAADLAYVTRALVVGTAGNVKVTTSDGDTVTLALPAGVIPIRVSRVWAASLTAANITALW